MTRALRAPVVVLYKRRVGPAGRAWPVASEAALQTAPVVWLGHKSRDARAKGPCLGGRGLRAAPGRRAVVPCRPGGAGHAAAGQSAGSGQPGGDWFPAGLAANRDERQQKPQNGESAAPGLTRGGFPGSIAHRWSGSSVTERMMVVPMRVARPVTVSAWAWALSVPTMLQ